MRNQWQWAFALLAAGGVLAGVWAVTVSFWLAGPFWLVLGFICGATAVGFFIPFAYFGRSADGPRHADGGSELDVKQAIRDASARVSKARANVARLAGNADEADLILEAVSDGTWTREFIKASAEHDAVAIELQQARNELGDAETDLIEYQRLAGVIPPLIPLEDRVQAAEQRIRDLEVGVPEAKGNARSFLLSARQAAGYGNMPSIVSEHESEAEQWQIIARQRQDQLDSERIRLGELMEDVRRRERDYAEEHDE